MDKTCEYCMGTSPVVYCEADSAHLCLSCDAKVHSANALSFRHPRTLVCESCKCQPTHMRCLEHEMFMCQSCDVNSHVSIQHWKKTIIGCYVGCPSAKDLAELWGFESNQSEKGPSVHRGSKAFKDLILQQIRDLEHLQLSGNVTDPTHGMISSEQSNETHKTMNHNENFGFQDTGGSSNVEKPDPEPICSPFSQIEESSFWQCKSPVLDNEIWLQSMQDLGVCDQVRFLDDSNIPDVDLTFRNFEELFADDQNEVDRSSLVEHQSASEYRDDDDHGISLQLMKISSGENSRTV